MGKPRISAVKYSNTLPLVWGMLRGAEKERFRPSFVTPADCAEALRKGQADIGLIPAIEYQRMEGLKIVSGISIASKGAAGSVLLLCQKPIHRIQSIAVDSSSRSSAALLRILMERFYCRRVDFIPSPPLPETMLQQADAAMILGDPALTYNGNCPEVYDLGEEWRKFTGLPFVFAFWAGRDEVDLAGNRQLLARSKEFGLAHLEEIVADHAPQLDLEPDVFRKYLSVTLDYSLDEENRRGLRHFFRLAHEMRLIREEQELRFV